MKIDLELDTRSKLLKAAVKVFSKEGFAGASVRQIADMAGVNHGSIKYHYSSKEHLWRSAIAYLFGEMERVVFAGQDKWDQMTPHEQMRDHISSYVRFNATHPELVRMIMFESIVQNERFEWLADNYLRPFSDRAINRTALAQEQGVYRSDIPPLNLYYMNVAASRTMFFAAPELQKQFGIDVFAEEEIERHIDALISLFVTAENEKVEQ
ncbi:MAG: TetR/AcrR family transcriptional regulator [Pseudomonadota bacterium]